MKTKSNRRGRRQRGYRGLLWVLAAGLLLFGLIAQQNILLGMKHTHFANCTGLTSPEHYSCAADLAVLLQAALNNETFRTVFTTGQYTSSVTAQHPKGLYMASTLLSRLDGGEVTGGQILGGKTGYTDAAGLCLASLAVVNEKEHILVTLGAPGNHATEQTNIMDAVQVYRRLEKKK